MLLRALAWLALFSAFAAAHIIEVAAGNKECFFEDLHKNDKVSCRPVCCLPNSHAWQMTVSYQVGGGGHLDIDFWVSSYMA